MSTTYCLTVRGFPDCQSEPLSISQGGKKNKNTGPNFVSPRLKLEVVSLATQNWMQFS